MPVVTIGYPAVRVLADQGRITSLAVDSPLDDMVDAVAALDGPVLVLHPAWAAEPALRHLRTAVSALEAGPLVVAASWLPPLAGGVLAALASAVSPRLAGMGVLTAALPALEAELVVVSRLGSVAALAHPEPSLAQHLRSWLPGRGFLVRVSPVPGIERLGRSSRTALPVPRHTFSWAVAFAEATAWPGWVRETVVASFPSPPRMVRVEPTVLGPVWAGTARLAEMVACPLELDGVAARAAASVPIPSSCAWCGEDVSGGPCPFCGMGDRESPPGIGAP